MPITQTITPLPTPPNPSTDDAPTFAAKASAFTQAIVQMVTEMNNYTAQANALAVGSTFGERYGYSNTTVAADPGVGKFRLDNVSWNLATKLFLSKTDSDNNAKGPLYATWVNNAQALKGLLRVTKGSNNTVYADFSISGALTDNGTWDTFNLVYVGGSGVFANNDPVVLTFQKFGADAPSQNATSLQRSVGANANITSADNGYNIAVTAAGLALTCDAPGALAGCSTFFYATQYGVLLNGTFINADGTASTQKAVPRGSSAILTSDGTNLHLEVLAPPNVYQTPFNASATLGLVDQGVDNYHTSATAHTATIPANAAVPYPIGTCLVFTNGTGAGVLSIAVTTDTLVQAGGGATGSRNLAANGTCVAKKIAATTWLISGSGLS